MTERSSQARAISGEGTRRVLLIEDDVSDAQLLRLMLGRATRDAFRVEHEMTLASAVKLLQAEMPTNARPEIIILDLGLPDSVGLSGLERIVAAAPMIPVIVLTGATDSELAREAVARDAQDFLTKWEFDAALLAKTIRHAMERSHLRSQLTQEKERAEQASRAKSDFLANMSHEIRTPMNTVLGMAEILRSTQLTAKQREHLDRLQRAGDHLLTLIEDILDISRIEAGRLEFVTAPFIVGEMIAAVTDIVRPLAAAKSITFDVEADDITLKTALVGDVGRFRQVLINLLGNAVKFTAEGTVTLVANTNRHAARCVLDCSVVDSGIGIPKDKLVSVFEQFVQADGTIRRRFGGTGLGLAISANLVRGMGGTLTAQSVPGEGSTFSVKVSLPIAEDVSGIQVSRDIDPAALLHKLEARSKPARVLLVDDHDDNHALVDAFVADVPVTIYSANDGPDAISKFEPAEFDIVLVDMHMPGMDGCAVVHALREIEAGTPDKRRTPMLILSADVLAETVTRAREAGADGYLSKPLRKTTLIEAIARYAPAVPQDVPRKRSGVYDARAAKPMAEIDSDIAALLPRFLENRRKDLRTLQASLESSAFLKIRTLAHNMRGTGTSYGFPRLSAIGTAMEEAALRSDEPAVKLEIAKLERELEVVASIVENAEGQARLRAGGNTHG